VWWDVTRNLGRRRLGAWRICLFRVLFGFGFGFGVGLGRLAIFPH
jgi:hypothetical protein